MRKIIRVLGSAVAITALTLSLAGCFVIPLADGRSPFDDPFGPSKSDVDNAIPEVQESLSELSIAPYGIEVYRGSDNCEGSCKLSPQIAITHEESSPAPEFIPAGVIAQVIVASEAGAPELPIRFSGDFDAGSFSEVTKILELIPAEESKPYYSEYYETIYATSEQRAVLAEAAEEYLAQ